MSVLKLISDIHLKHFPREKRNHLAVANCLAFIGDSKRIVDLLLELVADDKARSSSEDDELELVALQIAFDIVDNDEPHFASNVCALLPSVPETSFLPGSATVASAQPTTNGANPAEAGNDEEQNGMETEPLLPIPPEPSVPVAAHEAVVQHTKEQLKIAKLRNVLSGKVTAVLSLDFLCSHNRSDGFLLKKIKQALDGRSSVSHSALIFANAIAHAGTAIDTFLRENLDWLARATAWAKFSATSCLETGSYAWGSEAYAAKTRILNVVYNASNNELVRTNTLVKGAIVQIDATPFRQYYLRMYGEDIGKKKAGDADDETVSTKTAEKRAKRAGAPERVALDEGVKELFQSGRLLARIASRPGQCGRCDGYILEGKELEFYSKMMQKKKKTAGAK